MGVGQGLRRGGSDCRLGSGSNFRGMGGSCNMSSSVCPGCPIAGRISQQGDVDVDVLRPKSARRRNWLGIEQKCVPKNSITLGPSGAVE